MNTRKYDTDARKNAKRIQRHPVYQLVAVRARIVTNERDNARHDLNAERAKVKAANERITALEAKLAAAGLS